MSKPAKPYKVCVSGASTPLGRECFRSLSQSDEFTFVIAHDGQEAGKSMRELAGPRATDLTIEDKLGAALDRVETDILIDFNHGPAALQHALSALKRGVAPILGTALSTADLRELTQECKSSDKPALIIPNFGLGFVLFTHFAEIAAQWLPDVAIVETHPDPKHEQPCHLAKAVAQKIVDSVQEKRPPGSKIVAQERTGSWQDIKLHSLRIRGTQPTHTLYFGAAGETLTMSHEMHDHSSHVEGMRLAIREVWEQTGVVVGLETLLFGK